MRELDVPELQDWLEGPKAPARPYNKTLEEIRHEPIMILHSSGSTGLPKPIGYTHGCIAASKAQLNHASTGLDRTLLQCVASGARLFAGFPLFHAGGLYFPLAYALFAGVTIVLPPAGQPLSADMADLMHAYGNVQTSCLPPAILEDIAGKPSFLERMERISYVITGGAPLPKFVGDSIQQRGTRIYNMLASTETGIMAQLDVSPEDWQYIRFAPMAGADLRPRADGLYDLVIIRDEKLKGCQGVFENYPSLQEYSTQDLFRRHPEPQKSDHWVSSGRNDDVVVLLNGEKFAPSLMEQEIQGHSIVRTALVYGEARVQAALLIEVVEGCKDEPTDALLEQIWPTIERANSDCAAHGRLSKSLVLFTDPMKPMCRTPKGSVIRQATFKLYTDEIDALYAAQESHPSMNSLQTLDGSRITPSLLRELIGKATSLDMMRLKDDDNLFATGMDSLHVLHLTHNLNAALGKHFLVPGLIYMNPTIAKLANVLQSAQNRTVPAPDDRAGKINTMFKRYSMDLSIAHNQERNIAILTGSTGSLGSCLLKMLAEGGYFEKIYCLVRTIPTTTPNIDGRVIYLKCDFSEAHLGLGVDMYSDLLREVTHILHNAWQVDFNLSLESFENHIRGVRHLVDFSAQSNQKAHIFFISSVATVLNSNYSPVEEKMFEDSSMAQPMGYGESKHIAERLLYQAGLTCGVSSTIARVGQIAGPVHSQGVWNKREWLPSMIASSKHIGCIPNSLGAMHNIEWIPIDILSQIIIELFTHKNNNNNNSREHPTSVYHLVNPSPTTWPTLLPTVQEHLINNNNNNNNNNSAGQSSKPIEPVPLAEWTQRLQKSAASGLQDLASNPAIKLLDFFRDTIPPSDNGRVFPTLDTTVAKQHSPTLARLGPVKPEWMKLWMEQWRF